MNLGTAIHHEGFLAQQGVDGELWIVLTGTAATAQFVGIQNPAPSLDPSMPLGSDIRELSTLEVLKENAPAGLESQDKLKEVEPQIGAGPDPSDTTPPIVWRVLRREDNPGDVTVRFWIVLVTGKDAQA